MTLRQSFRKAGSLNVPPTRSNNSHPSLPSLKSKSNLVSPSMHTQMGEYETASALAILLLGLTLVLSGLLTWVQQGDRA